jgi:hypothetical protein
VLGQETTGAVNGAWDARRHRLVNGDGAGAAVSGGGLLLVAVTTLALPIPLSVALLALTLSFLLFAASHFFVLVAGAVPVV